MRNVKCERTFRRTANTTDRFTQYIKRCKQQQQFTHEILSFDVLLNAAVDIIDVFFFVVVVRCYCCSRAASRTLEISM